MRNSMRRIGDGSLGGKGEGLVRLHSCLEELRQEQPELCAAIDLPKYACLSADIYQTFLIENDLTNAVQEVGRDAPSDPAALQERIRRGIFPSAVERQLTDLLATWEGPLAVRSSSLLEDQVGAAFAGKYESVFVVPRGEGDERLRLLLDGIREVYASTVNANALAYRRKHDLLDRTEAMAVVIQPIVGRAYGRFLYPLLAGVAFSQNGYCWNKQIQKGDGLVRLVCGLGTRAVGRGYVRLFSPSAPGMRPEGTEVTSIQKCSQKHVDVIDLDEGKLATVHFRELITDGFHCPAGAQAMISLKDGNYLYRPVSNLWDDSHIPVLTLDGILSGSWMGIDLPKTIGWLLKALEEKLGFAVDLEFAVDVDAETKRACLFLLQARPLSQRAGHKPHPIPEIARERILFRAQRNIPTAHVPEIEYLVWVDDVVYHGWAANDRQSVARIVGTLNERLREHRFALVGPGRWGSWNPQLGVPVSYAEIAHAALLIEVARRRATYVPEVSFGSHFFQDLIEDDIAYLPLYPDEPGERFNEDFLQQQSVFSELLPDEYYRRYDELIRVLHIPSLTAGKMATAILNGESGEALIFLEPFT